MSTASLLTREEALDKVLSQMGIGLGTLCLPGMTKTLDYALYEVSQHNIGIISNAKLTVGAELSLSYAAGLTIPMILHQLVPGPDLPQGFYRYRLITTDPEINFEKIVPETSHGKASFANRHHFQLRFTRFATDVPLRVEARTFGSVELYPMKTINISKTGLLLASAPGFRSPFNESTLLELSLFIEGDAIQCLGRVVRCELDLEKKYKRYAVQIVDFLANDKERYFALLADIEHSKNRQTFRALRIQMPL